MRIPPRLAKQLILRGLVIWMGLEILALFVGGLSTRLSAPDAAFVFRFHIDHIIPMLMFAALVAWFDLVKRDEQVFFANLGLSTAQLVFFYLIPAATCEAALLLV